MQSKVEVKEQEGGKIKNKNSQLRRTIHGLIKRKGKIGKLEVHISLHKKATRGRRDKWVEK